MDKQTKLVLYATTENGNGLVQKIGEYDDIEGLQIVLDVFSRNTILSFGYETKED